jgi:hypothetical protein
MTIVYVLPEAEDRFPKGIVNIGLNLTFVGSAASIRIDPLPMSDLGRGIG